MRKISPYLSGWLQSDFPTFAAESIPRWDEESQSWLTQRFNVTTRFLNSLSFQLACLVLSQGRPLKFAQVLPQVHAIHADSTTFAGEIKKEKRSFQPFTSDFRIPNHFLKASDISLFVSPVSPMSHWPEPVNEPVCKPIALVSEWGHHDWLLQMRVSQSHRGQVDSRRQLGLCHHGRETCLWVCKQSGLLQISLGVISESKTWLGTIISCSHNTPRYASHFKLHCSAVLLQRVSHPGKFASYSSSHP